MFLLHQDHVRLDESSVSFLRNLRSIYVLNLPERLDRRREIQAQLELVGLSLDMPFVRLFPAMRPEDKGEWP